MENLLNELEDQKKLVFEYCGKKIEVTSKMTLTELQDEFGYELDILDIFKGKWTKA